MSGAALWDPLQREALEAMGLTVLRLAVPAAPTASAGGPAGAADADAAHAVGAIEATRSPDPLIAALLRAAGRSPGAADAARLASEWPSPDALRRDPRAKRALWPRLRALRRTPP